MTFASEATKPNSDRYSLVKLTPARYVSDDLASQGGGIYDMAWSYDIERVERNGTALTEVSASPSSNDEWYYDGTTLELKLAAAPSSTNVIVVFYNLYYTSSEYQIATKDPEDSNTDEVHWEPKLLVEPVLKQNVSNVIDGVITSQVTAVQISNPDASFQDYLTDNDSFYQKTVKCWLCINGVSNIQKMFEGRINAISLSKETVTLQIYDIFSLLDQPALMNDPADDAYWLRANFPSMYPPDENKIIPYIIGASSFHKTKRSDRLWTVTNSNRYLDFTDDASTEVAQIGFPGNTNYYSISDFTSAVASALNSATTDFDAEYTVDFNTSTRKFTISVVDSTTLQLHWNTGANAANDLSETMGFDISDDTGATSYTSDDEGVHLDLAEEMVDGMEAVCTNYRSYISTSGFNIYNREWGLCRTNSGGVGSIDVDRTSHASFSVDFLTDPQTQDTMEYTYWVVGSNNDCQIGDTFRVSDASTNESHHRVVWVNDFQHDGTTYNMATVRDGTMVSGTPTTIDNLDAVTVVIKDNNNNYYYPVKDRDYSISEASLTSGNKYISINFSGNMESNTGKPSALDPTRDKVYFRVGSSTNKLHSAALKELGEAAGLTTNASSFTTAGTSLAINALMSIPAFDERSSVKSYRHYMEKICMSTMGILHMNNSFELEYLLLDTPTSTDATDDNKFKSINIIIQYRDIVTELVAFNPAHETPQTIDATKSPSETVSSDVGKHLHGIKNSVRFRHVLEQITDRIQDIFDILSHRRAIYKFETATDNLASEIGDDLQLETSQILGTGSVKDLTIIGIDKSNRSVVVQATDLLDI